MRFLSIYKTVETNTPPSLEHIAQMGKLIEESMKAGVLLATEGCLPSALGARVRRSEGKITVTDGPFAETKEVIGGFAILQANSKEEAIDSPRDFSTWRARASARSVRSSRRPMRHRVASPNSTPT
jgi:hypothetical protein